MATPCFQPQNGEHNREAILAKLNQVEEQLRVAEEKQARARTDAQTPRAATFLEESNEIQRLRLELEHRERALRQRMDRARPMSPEEIRAVGDAQVRADSVYQNVNRRAPPPRPFEREHEYRARVCDELKRYSEHRDLDFSKMPLGALTVFETQIYADAMRPNAILADARPGEIMAVKRHDTAGRPIVEYYGTDTFIKGMTTPSRQVEWIGEPRDVAHFYQRRMGRR